MIPMTRQCTCGNTMQRVLSTTTSIRREEQLTVYDVGIYACPSCERVRSSWELKPNRQRSVPQ